MFVEPPVDVTVVVPVKLQVPVVIDNVIASAVVDVSVIWIWGENASPVITFVGC